MPHSDEMTYLRPLDLISGAAARSMCEDGRAVALAGGPLAFTHVEVIVRGRSGKPERSIHSPLDLKDWLSETAGNNVGACLARLREPREKFAGNVISGDDGRPVVMGVVNVTPDSFSDGGDYADADAAIVHGRALRAAGADLIDIGGESTRPGAAPVSVDEELARVMPVVSALAGDGVPVSIDTRRAVVMREAIAAGACVVNDVSALAHDPDALEVVASSDASIILMHMQGLPETMQNAPRYDDVGLDVYDALAGRVAACSTSGARAARAAPRWT